MNVCVHWVESHLQYSCFSFLPQPSSRVVVCEKHASSNMLPTAWSACCIAPPLSPNKCAKASLQSIYACPLMHVSKHTMQSEFRRSQLQQIRYVVVDEIMHSKSGEQKITEPHLETVLCCRFGYGFSRCIGC